MVQLRHDVCHGNILNVIQRMAFEKIETLTPECLRTTAASLQDLAYRWTLGLAQFRARNGRRPEGVPIPPIPENPVAAWLESAKATS